MPPIRPAAADRDEYRFQIRRLPLELASERALPGHDFFLIVRMH